MHPQRRVINHLAPVSTRCTSFPLAVLRIARARRPLKGSEKRRGKKDPRRKPCDGNRSTIFQSPAESATRALPLSCHATRSPPRDSLVLALLYRGRADHATGRKNAILVAPRGVVSSSASPSARRIMQSRLARRSPSVLAAPRNALARLPPSIIGRIGYRRHAPPVERSAGPSC